MAERLMRSGPKAPCPACGRTKDADCAWNNELILCHMGHEPRPTDQMKPGQTLEIRGRQWALVRTKAGYSGRADLLRPHIGTLPPGGLNFRSKIQERSYQQAMQIAKDRVTIQTAKFLALVAVVREHLDPYYLNLDELRNQEQTVWAGIEAGKHLSSLRNSLRGELSDRESKRLSSHIAQLQRELHYQAQNTAVFRETHLEPKPPEGNEFQTFRAG